MNIQEKIEGIISALKKDYPDALCALEYHKDYELMFAARLSAQCTDERVNVVTKTLFRDYPTLESFAEADPEDIGRLIYSCGFYNTKSKDLVLCAQKLISEYGGKVPDTMEQLLSLPGIGRKTANLMLGDIFKKPAVITDTHCIRICNKLGLVSSKDPQKVEFQLREILPPEESSDFCHRIVLHGRAVCKARKPDCPACSLAIYCDAYSPAR